MVKIRTLFVTCTTAEAIEEINIMLEEAGSEIRVTEDNIVKTVKAKKVDDWFDDYEFYFEIEVPNVEIDKLNKSSLDFEIIS